MSLTSELRQQIADSYAAGERAADIAGRHGVTRAAVNMIAKRSGIPPRYPFKAEAMSGLKTFSPEQISVIEVMLRDGSNPTRVAEHFGVSRCTVLRAIDPEYRRRRAEQIAANREGGVSSRRVAGLVDVRSDGHDRLAARDAERLMALVPADTRCLTARMFGDPLPGRSAFDARYRTPGKDTHS